MFLILKSISEFSKEMRSAFSCIFILFSFFTSGQTLGGNTVFNFLRLPATPQLTALGGVNVSVISNDVGLAFNNPSLLREEMHTQLNVVFNDFYSGISSSHLSLAYRHQKLKTNFAWGLQYFDYGKITETDASGNIIGSVNPADWVMQISASRSYREKWNYGAAMKFISSNYGLYRSNGIALDAGLLYRDSANLFSASVLVKNVGTQLKKYTGTLAEELPFDLQAGISKKLKDAPFSFSLTANRLHLFDTRYNDTVFNNENGITGGNKKFTLDKLFRHFILAAQIHPSSQIEFTIAYNHLRRQELNVANTANGLNGFSMGVAAVFSKIQIRYARSQYQNNTGYNQIGLNLTLQKMFGLGKFGERINW